MNTERVLTLHFIDGKKLSFTFPEQAELDAAKRIKLKSLWESPYVIMEVEGQLMVFPISNIKCIQFSGNFGNTEEMQFPAHTIRGASIVS